MKLENLIKTSAAGVALLSTVACTSPGNTRGSEEQMLRDAALTQTQYTQEQVKALSCQNQLDRYKGVKDSSDSKMNAVAEFVTNLFDSGYSCSEENSQPKEIEAGLLTIIDLVHSNDKLNCGYNLTSDAILSPTESWDYKLKAASNLVKSNYNYMPAISNGIRQCIVENGVKDNYKAAFASDVGSVIMWIGIGYGLSSEQNSGVINPNVGGTGSGSQSFGPGNVTHGVGNVTN